MTVYNPTLHNFNIKAAFWTKQTNDRLYDTCTQYWQALQQTKKNGLYKRTLLSHTLTLVLSSTVQPDLMRSLSTKKRMLT